MVLYLFVGFDDDYILKIRQEGISSGSDHCICEYKFIFSVDVGNNFTDIFPSTDLLELCGKAKKKCIKLN